MKPKRYYFHQTPIFGHTLSYGAPLVAGFMVLISGIDAQAGDILRGGGAQRGKGSARKASNIDTPTPAATDAARANARDQLARTDRTLAAMRAMQNAARNAANKGPNNLGKNPLKPTVNLPKVPNGLVAGGLKVSGTITTDPTKWSGAKLPTQSVKNGKTKVTVKQTEQQALLEWETFNVGKNTTLTFDQKKGGENAGQWIAFNKISDPTANPTQILGNIKADGQVYIINPNGIIFGGSSQVNARGLTASSLPINDNLVSQGLLNNRDAQFLFSAFKVPGGSDGTPAFNPETPANGKFGDVIVRKGATLTSPASAGGNGGRVTLVGANVSNEGTISTESGQTILAAGLQVAFAAHDASDPSLRGLDVWVGDVGTYAGTVINNGIIDAPTGSISMTGRNLVQSGVLDSTTSVSLNGRIDLKASYGAVANPNFDSTTEQGSGGPMFFNQFTGVVTLGEKSSTRILPDYESKKLTPGIALPERSQINIEGLAIHFDKNSSLFAPNGEVSVRAGTWTYKDADGNRTIFGVTGAVETGITNHYTGKTQRFLLDAGQIHVDESASVSVAGSVDVFVPLAHSLLEVEFRGSELADSPLLRDPKRNIRGVPLTVDIRTSGSFNGKYWIGTPLGDVAGLAGLIQRNAAQLTASGGNISFQSGGSIVVSKGSALDVSGGYYRHEAGDVKASYLIQGSRLVAIKDATPDQIYDGVFNGESTFIHEKWGVSKTFSTSLFSATHSKSYVEGAAGGSLSLTAPTMALDGELRGITVKGPQQRSTPPAASSIKISFQAEKAVTVPGGTAVNYITHSPTPPAVVFSNKTADVASPAFSLVNGAPTSLLKERTDSVVLSKELLGEEGFGSLEIRNPDGSITVPKNVTLTTEPKGSITLEASNLTVLGSVVAPGGKLSFTTYNISPSFAAEYSILNPSGSVPFPAALANRGLFTLGSGARLSTAGLISDDRPQSNTPAGEDIVTAGGSISIRSYNANLQDHSIIDVSGGVHVSDKAAKSYGKAGTISITTGNDAGFAGVLGGTLDLQSTLRGYSGTTGGTLNIQASLIQLGGTARPGFLNLSEDFFRSGGFAKYSLAGIGARSTATPPVGQFESYVPAVSIADGAKIRPLAESYIAKENLETGAITLKRFTNEDGLRNAVSLSFNALGSDDPFTIDSLEVRGDIFMGKGSSIHTEPGATVSFKGGTVTLLGSVVAPGGTITVAGASSFPLTASQRLNTTQALPTVHLGDQAKLSAAGILQLKPDAFGRRVGTVYDGGVISVSGNILAEKGSLLTVEGASGILDLDPLSLAATAAKGSPTTGGLTSKPEEVQGIATRVDSDGGTIDLSGSQMLLSDATLLGKAGGSTARGGQLVISSGRYYRDGESRTGADINLVVTQSGDVIRKPDAIMGVGTGLLDENGAAYGNQGAFSIDRFTKGSFTSLSLGGKYFAGATPIPYGGNIEFQGKIDLKVSGTLRLAAGGIIKANDTVNISASYLAIGQDFRNPENPDDITLPFQKDPALPTSKHNFAPTYGAGSLILDAKLIDVGTLSLQSIGNASLTSSGDIRGNGTFHIAGNATFKAEQVYPTSLASFSIFAYDHAKGTGSVTIRTNGKPAGVPLSAGGHLSVFASTIHQLGVLRAPMGSISLGWDGTDLDPGDSDIDSPYDIIAGTSIAAPITSKLTLGDDSLTSVSAATEKDEPAWLAPFGMSPDGQTWIDPRGVNVTLTGLPGKSVSITAANVDMKPGASVDIRGGGELLATRWVPGIGGSIDLLGAASSAWGGGTEYQAGDLVSFGGETWSARVRNTGQSPTIGLYWTKVAESFAIIPESNLRFAPINAFNTGSNADSLAGDPGYVNTNLDVGDTITLDGSMGVPAGTYTLLPRRYALLPGAWLVTPVSGSGNTTIRTADGARLVSGFLGNRFNDPNANPSELSRFEIASSKVVANRVSYERYTATDFLGGIADKLELERPQLLPGDAGYALFQGNSSLRLAGKLHTESPGLGATVDVSSTANITISNGASSAPGSVSIDSAVLTSWKADSLLVGGVRRTTNGGNTVVDVHTSHLKIDNPGGDLTGKDIVLVSNGSLEITSGSSISSDTTTSFKSTALTLTGDGTLLRTSADGDAIVTRTGAGASTAASLTIGSSASLKGASVFIDSTYATALATDALIEADDLSLASGQISIVLSGSSSSLTGSEVSPHLTLAGDTLDLVLRSENLTLQSYRSIDFYGSGTFGSGSLKNLTLGGNGLRGFSTTGTTLIQADVVNLGNTGSIAAPTLAGSGMSELTIDAGTIRLGENAFKVSGFEQLNLNASSEILVSGKGSFATTGNLTALTPLLTGEAGASHAIHATGTMTLNRSTGKPGNGGGLGAVLDLSASSITANADILLPSGELTLRATQGDLIIGGMLSVEGTSRVFNDLTRHANAGNITLQSASGDVILTSQAVVSVSASSAGGSAGSIAINAAKGGFRNQGSLLAIAANDYKGGRFLLDVGSLSGVASSFASINDSLDAGNFTQSRDFRVRTGDITVAGTIKSHHFSLGADQGSILVTGNIDASGKTGGSIALAACGNLTIASGVTLNVYASHFDSAGKGGSILLEAGTQSAGIANDTAQLNLDAGAKLLLGVAEYVTGAYTTPGSSAFQGKFNGTLHLRAPRTADNTDLQIGAIQSTIIGASSIVAEGYKLYAPTNGVMNIALRNQINADSNAFLGAAGVGNANEAAIRSKLLNVTDPAGLDSILVVAPGVEIVNLTGDLTLGLANNANNGTTNVEALAAADWDLSKFRYGIKAAAGVLTLRAHGDLVFNNTLSDGFNPIAQGSAQIFADNGHSLMWLGRLMTISENLPANQQSWSYRLTAGADTNASNFRSVFSPPELDLQQPGKGSVIVGEFYPAVPNKLETGLAAAIGIDGQTADSIRISATTTNRGNRFEVIRTGTGDITISAGRDVQLRNQFSSIYTAGVAIPKPTTVFSENDFVVPVIPTSINRHPSLSSSGTTLGSVQQLYQPNWSLAGGNISISAQADIGRFTMSNGVITADSSRQMPTNWLYRRGYVDPSTGLFAADGGFGSNPNIQNSENVNDTATSTTWWIDFSNFFQGVGTLGGGNIDINAGNDVINMDAVAPTNARMAGRKKNPDFGIVANAPEYINLAPDESNFIEYGGGDVTVRSGRNIDGGIFYVEKGKGALRAGGSITTNAARSPSLGILDGSAPLDPLTWMPTTLFVGKSHFDVTALGDVLLGPVTNAFLMPQGLNNRYWYKTSFSTFAPDSGVAVSSYGGSVTHRMKITLPGSATSRSILDVWYTGQNLFTGSSSESNASNYQPWLRLTELDLGTYSSVFNLAAPNLRSTSFAGDINIAGSVILAPSPTGDLELAAAGSIIGLQNTGLGRINNKVVNVWTSSVINVSDASPSSIPGVTSPLAYQSIVGRNQAAALQSSANLLRNVNLALDETGSSTGQSGTVLVKKALHGSGILHLADPNPVKLYALGGDITGFTLFSPKETRILARRDIVDIAFFIQNVEKSDVTLVAAGRDIIPFNENASIRSLATNLNDGNFVGDTRSTTVTGTSTNAMSGDIQINGPGMLEVLSGRNLDLGTGANFIDGTGVGITSIGNIRNPNLPFAGADIIALAGVTAPGGDGPAHGLSMSSMNIDGFIATYLKKPEKFDSTYWNQVAPKKDFDELTEEQQAIIALEKFYSVLSDTGKKAIKTGKYKAGYKAVKKLFGKHKPKAELFTRAREIRTTSGGAISLGVPGGSITMASEIFGNPLTPPGIVTEYGGAISTFTNRNVDIGQARIFTLRGGDITMWSSNGNIAAGTSPRTVVTAPPTRVVIDISSADIQTDLGGLATGGGIGVLAAVEGVKPANVSLIAPKGYVDAGDAGITATGNITIAANVVLNATNISSGGSTSGAAPSAPAAPSVAAVTSASNAATSSTSTAAKPTEQQQTTDTAQAEQESASLFTVEVIGYGTGAKEEEDEEDNSQTPEP